MAAIWPEFHQRCKVINHLMSLFEKAVITGDLENRQKYLEAIRTMPPTDSPEFNELYGGIANVS